MVKLKATSLNTFWAELIVEELLRNNINQFVLSSGSRCTPLVSSIALNNRCNKIIHFDERGAAYFAIGYARATGKPAVLVCTSGTAAANYFPAVVEASMDMVPVILLTADRPSELQDCGANQTIDQVNLYGKYILFHFDLPCPTEKISPEFVLSTIDQAVYRAARPPMGPVHINCMFREPLAPVKQKSIKLPIDNIRKWLNSKEPLTVYEPPVRIISDNKIIKIASILNQAKYGILVIGYLKTMKERDAACQLSQKLNWPTFVDIRSGLKLGYNKSNNITYFDQLLLSEKSQKKEASVIMHLGGVPTSKQWQLFLQKHKPEHYIHIDDHPYRHDPYHRVTDRIESNIGLFCQKLIPQLRKSVSKADSYLKQFQKRDNVTGKVIDTFVNNNLNLTEPAIARCISKHIVKDSCLFLGSSMPIRDMDMYGDPAGYKVNVAANRGASGIDGTIATAAGFVYGSHTLGTLLIGDLAFLHDINSLALLNKTSIPLTIVLINNNGGGIFSMLPVAEFEEIFEPFFGTPHNLTFEKIAEMFGLDYYQPTSKESFIKNYQAAQKSNHSSIIEVQTDRKENCLVHLSLLKKIKSAIDNL